MCDHLSLSELNEIISRSRCYIDNYKKIPFLFAPSSSVDVAQRKLTIIQVLRDRSKNPLVHPHYKFGSLLTLKFIDLLCYIAKVLKNFKALKKYIHSEGTKSDRIRLASLVAKKPQSRLSRIKIEEPRPGTIPLKEWFTDLEQQQILHCFFNDNENHILWEYISRVRNHKRLKQILFSNNIIPTRKRISNQYILFSALIQRDILDWCPVPVIRDKELSPLEIFLCWFGSYNFNPYNLYVKSSSLPENFDDCCAICLEKITQYQFRRIKETNCNHFFHKGCLFEWFKHQPTCPLCKTRVVHSKLPHYL